MRPIDQRNFVLLWLQESGETTSEIAQKTGLALRTVQEGIQRAKDLQDHLRLKGQSFGDPDWIHVLLKGVNVCIHGMPTTHAGTWVCAFCTKTNNDSHPAFRRGKADYSLTGKADKDLSAAEIAKKVQPKGTPAFIPRLRKKKHGR